MKGMIELLIPILGREIGEEKARKEMTTLFPTLERWK
ncbi:zinc ribbon domain-containing protein [Clostridium saccharoperbutylacetonicum]